MRVASRTVGRLRVHALDAGRIRLDGGAMFGVVPKPLWEKKIPPDDRNRIPLALRCLLIETPGALVLVDTGIGNKEDAKFRDIYGVENEGSPTRLEDAIREAGFAPDDVTDVVNTHLHFDHAGGNTHRDGRGAVRISFPQARYWMRRGEWEFAHQENERVQTSYLRANFDPVEAAGRSTFIETDREIVPGVHVRHTPGHTPHHQSVLLESEGERALYLADLVPTTAHVPLPWIMGYDVEPLVTLETKRRVLRQAEAEGWLLIFEHDPEIAWGRLASDGKRSRLVPDPAA